MHNFKLQVLKTSYSKRLKECERFYEIIESNNTTSRGYALANYSGQMFQIKGLIDEIDKLIATDLETGELEAAGISMRNLKGKYIG